MSAGFGYIYSGGVLTVTVAGTPVSINAEHPKRDHILMVLGDQELSDEQKEEKVIDLLSQTRTSKIQAALEALSTDDIEVKIDHGVVTIKGEPIENALTGKMLEMAAAKIPFDGLVNFMVNLSQNPSEESRKQLFQFLDRKGFPITPDGHFLGYRGVRADFKDKHSGRFDNTPGSILEMPREQVCADPNQSCAPGFHIGTFRYASGWAPSGGHVVLVKVNPADAVSVPNHETEKLRVCRFEVIRVYEGEDVLQRPQYTDEEIHSEALLAEEEHFKLNAPNYVDPWDEDAEIEQEIPEPTYEDLVEKYNAMNRDEVCREAARTGIFFSTNEARDMGKEFVVHAMASGGIPFEDCTMNDLIKLSVRRGLFASPSSARKKGRAKIISVLRNS